MAIKIKLWADYGCWPLWGVDEIDNIEPADENPRSRKILSAAWVMVFSLMFQTLLNSNDFVKAFGIAPFS